MKRRACPVFKSSGGRLDLTSHAENGARRRARPAGRSPCSPSTAPSPLAVHYRPKHASYGGRLHGSPRVRHSACLDNDLHALQRGDCRLGARTRGPARQQLLRHAQNQRKGSDTTMGNRAESAPSRAGAERRGGGGEGDGRKVTHLDDGVGVPQGSISRPTFRLERPRFLACTHLGAEVTPFTAVVPVREFLHFT